MTDHEGVSAVSSQFGGDGNETIASTVDKDTEGADGASSALRSRVSRCYHW